MQRRFIVLLSLLLAGTASALTASPIALASPAVSSSVFVARDVTADGACILVQRTSKGSTQVSYSQRACPSGTVIQLFKISKFEAVARGEHFVALPQTLPSTASGQAGLERQVEALIDEVRTAARKSPGGYVAQPFDTISCEMDRTLEVSYSPGWDTQNVYIGEVNYSKPALYCPNIQINWSSITASVSHSAGYWKDDKYGGSTFGRNCQYISTTGNVWNMNVEQTVGFEYLQEVSNGSHCFPWDSTSSFDVGTLG